MVIIYNSAGFITQCNWSFSRRAVLELGSVPFSEVEELFVTIVVFQIERTEGSNTSRCTPRKQEPDVFNSSVVIAVKCFENRSRVVFRDFPVVHFV
ncbi:hypothetical protein EL22_27795 [Halostagnicola sp. A56]|nr:hypothetical protein EL22_27795 [Halostagnicola sp. A56]